MKELEQLVNISQFYGKNKDFAIAGGGNTSYKNDTHLWVKASGTSLGTITETGFVQLNRSTLQQIAEKQYSSDPLLRESEVKEDLYRSLVYPSQPQRPSVETSLHEIISYSYVVHMHPTVVNALLCSVDSKKMTAQLFGDNALYIEYTDPGYVLFKRTLEGIRLHEEMKGKCPQIILLENHGIFVAADTTDEIKSIYNSVISIIHKGFPNKLKISDVETPEILPEVLPAIRMMLSEEAPKLTAFRTNSLVQSFVGSKESFEKISGPFTPDIIVYCKSEFLFIENNTSEEEIIAEFKEKLGEYKEKHPFLPKVVLIKDVGMIAADDNYASAEIILDVFEDLMKISHYTVYFGGPRFMSDKQIEFIDNWEVENYRRKVSKGANSGKVSNKIVVVTGGAQGFGGGLVERMFEDGANIVIADINEEKGLEYAAELNIKAKKNKAIFIKTDVSNDESVKNLINKSVENFGGVDVFISNAGVLRAGGLDEMDAKTFEFMTKVNYSGYFLCAKHASKVMKQQAEYSTGFHFDIIQVNSKSGLKGSNKNFAYAGGKFGGIGLTQSFALELMPHRIKVNSICPGNFFDGPLWSDPDKGLFVQYLKAGKVPGAKTLEDVKKFYENQVPANRGCLVEDVLKAVYYVIDQEYETGQAVPVTGGQIMLS